MKLFWMAHLYILLALAWRPPINYLLRIWTIQSILAHYLSFACIDYAEQFNGVTWPPETIGHLLSAPSLWPLLFSANCFLAAEESTSLRCVQKTSFPFLFYALSLTARREGGNCRSLGYQFSQKQKDPLDRKEKGKKWVFSCQLCNFYGSKNQ